LHCKSSKGIPAPPTLNLATGIGTGAENSKDSTEKKKKEKKLIVSPRPRPLPLFARPDAGHVVFRGNEVLDQKGGF
jgi:ribonuclease P protein subunit RPR2